jgi:cobalamin biosynthesis Co2+ chelatase CbiK
MNKLTTNMMKTVQDMLKDSKDISISNLPPFSSTKDFMKVLQDIKRTIDKSKGKNITIIVSID